MTISRNIKNKLYDKGASLVGFADLRSLPANVRENFDFGIAILLAYTKEAMSDNLSGDMSRYHREWAGVNMKLAELGAFAAGLLTSAGYKAWGKTQPTVLQDQNMNTVLPHKTVGTLSGIGWIGKNAALVTREFGGAFRMVTVLTNAPLECGVPETESLCDPDCRICASVCPGQAVLGGQWRVGTPRGEFFDAFACKPAARARAKQLLDMDETLCALCISHCPWTRKALGY